MVRGFYTLQSVMDRQDRQKISEYKEDLNSIINKLDIIDINEYFIPKQQNTHSSWQNTHQYQFQSASQQQQIFVVPKGPRGLQTPRLWLPFHFLEFCIISFVFLKSRVKPLLMAFYIDSSTVDSQRLFQLNFWDPEWVGISS